MGVILNLSHTLIHSKLSQGLRTHRTIEISPEEIIDIFQPYNFIGKKKNLWEKGTDVFNLLWNKLKKKNKIDWWISKEIERERDNKVRIVKC